MGIKKTRGRERATEKKEVRKVLELEGAAAHLHPRVSRIVKSTHRQIRLFSPSPNDRRNRCLTLSLSQLYNQM